MLFQVSFKANLEGVAELGLNIDEGFDLMVKCTKCNEERGPVHLDPNSWDDLNTNDRTQANIVFSCKFCRCGQNITLVADSVKTFVEERGPGAQNLFVLDCRGVEPIKVCPVPGMMWAKCESGTKFDAIELPEWYDYDESSQMSVSLTEPEFSIKVTK